MCVYLLLLFRKKKNKKYILSHIFFKIVFVILVVFFFLIGVYEKNIFWLALSEQKIYELRSQFFHHTYRPIN